MLFLSPHILLSFPIFAYIGPIFSYNILEKYLEDVKEVPLERQQDTVKIAVLGRAKRVQISPRLATVCLQLCLCCQESASL